MNTRLAHVDDIDEIFNIFMTTYDEKKMRFNELAKSEFWKQSIYYELKKMVSANPSVVATEDDKIVGYLSGYCPISNYRGSQKSVSTPEWGHAVIHGDKARVYDAMFAQIWSQWIEKRCYNHSITYLVDDKLEKYLFDMSYGSIVENAIISIENYEENFKKFHGSNEGVLIREARKEDLETLLAFVTLFINKLNEKPIFRYGSPSTIDEVEYEFFEKKGICLVAEKDNRIIACMRGHFGASKNSELIFKDTNIAIDYAFVKKEYRDMKIARTLLYDLICRSSNKNMKTCTVDYETHNYNAKVFWRNHFNVFTKTLIRKIDDRF